MALDFTKMRSLLKELTDQVKGKKKSLENDGLVLESAKENSQTKGVPPNESLSVIPPVEPTPMFNEYFHDVDCGDHDMDDVLQVLRDTEAKYCHRHFAGISKETILGNIQEEFERRLPGLRVEVSEQYGKVSVKTLTPLAEKKTTELHPYVTVNEARIAEGLLPIENGDLIDNTLKGVFNAYAVEGTLFGREEWSGLRDLLGKQELGPECEMKAIQEKEEALTILVDEDGFGEDSLPVDFAKNRRTRAGRHTPTMDFTETSSTMPTSHWMTNKYKEQQALKKEHNDLKQENIKVTKVQPVAPTKEQMLASALQTRKQALEQEDSWLEGKSVVVPEKVKSRPKPSPAELQVIRELVTASKFVQYETAQNWTRKNTAWRIGLVRVMDWDCVYECIIFNFKPDENLVDVTVFVDDDLDNGSKSKQILDEYRVNTRSALGSVKSYLAKGFEYHPKTLTDEAIDGLVNIHAPGQSHSMALPKHETDLTTYHNKESYEQQVKKAEEQQLKEKLKAREDLDYDFGASIAEKTVE